MLIGKLTLLLFVGLLLNGCASVKNNVASQKPQEAWWLTKQFRAMSNNIDGIPLSDINKDWKLVSVLDMAYLKAHLSNAQYKDIQDHPALSLSIQASLDGVPGLETFLVGVYESYSGKTGRFIAIKHDSKIIKYFMHPGIAGYSSLYLDNNKLRWYQCMQCNGFDVVFWDNGKYVIQ